MVCFVFKLKTVKDREPGCMISVTIPTKCFKGTIYSGLFFACMHMSKANDNTCFLPTWEYFQHLQLYLFARVNRRLYPYFSVFTSKEINILKKINMARKLIGRSIVYSLPNKTLYISDDQNNRWLLIILIVTTLKKQKQNKRLIVTHKKEGDAGQSQLQVSSSSTKKSSGQNKLKVWSL